MASVKSGLSGTGVQALPIEAKVEILSSCQFGVTFETGDWALHFALDNNR